MNSFGRNFRIQIFGESHGVSVGIIIDGCPAGLALSVEDFIFDLDRRRGAVLKGTTSRNEDDIPNITSGVFNGFTTGAPILIIFENKDVRSSDYEKVREIPRPGHADFVAAIKAGGYQDFRGSGHYSGRLTVAHVAAGVVAKKILLHTQDNPVLCQSSIIEAGGEKDIERAIDKAIAANDSIGGIVECKAVGLPMGLGEPFFDSMESLISHIVFSIPAIRGIEFGTGFKAARLFCSEHNDALQNEAGKNLSNHAGGITGGLTNGNDLVFRVAVKPTSSTPKAQQSLNIKTGELENFSIKGRHDLCIALRVPVILESVTACVIADLLMQSGKLPVTINPKKNLQ